MEDNKKIKAEELRKKLLALNEKGWADILDTSNDKEEYLFDRATRMAGKPKEFFEHALKQANKANQTPEAKKKRLANRDKKQMRETATKNISLTWENNSKQVNQYSKDGKFLNSFKSITEARECLGRTKGGISEAAKENGTQRYAYGYVWRYTSKKFPVNKDITIPKYVRPTSKAVNQYSLNGEYITTFDSILEAQQALNLKYPGGISEVAAGKAKKAFGFIWRYRSEKFPVSKDIIIEKKRRDTAKPVEQYSLDGKYLSTYPSIRDAGQALNLKYYGSIGDVAAGKNKTAFGFIWKYID